MIKIKLINVLKKWRQNYWKKYILWQKISVSEKCVFQWKIGFWVDNRRLKTNPTLVNWLSITNVSYWNNCLRQVLRHVLEDVSVWACVSVRACVRLNKFFVAWCFMLIVHALTWLLIHNFYEWKNQLIMHMRKVFRFPSQKLYTT